MIKNEIIKDLKETISRLQQECTEKTDSIIRLGEQLQAERQKVKELEQWQEDAENILKTQLDNFDKIEDRYKQALEEIKEIAKYMSDGDNQPNGWDEILQKCEVLNNE